MRIVILSLLTVVVMSSCTKVINVDLNSSSPQYVIEGAVTDAAGPYLVRITRSVNFSEERTYPAERTAIVTIDDNGTTDTLHYTTNGLYQTRYLTGTPGHTYTLRIAVDGTT